MQDPIPGLEALLWSHLEQAPDDYSPEAPMVNMLLEIMRGYGDGHYNRSEVLTNFKRHVPGFDVVRWMHTQSGQARCAPAPTLSPRRR